MARAKQLKDATLSYGSSFEQARFMRLGAGHFRFGQLGRLLPLFLRPSRFLRPVSSFISNTAPQAPRRAEKDKLASSGWAALSHDRDGRLGKFGSREAAGIAIRLCCLSGSEFRFAFPLRSLCSATVYRPAECHTCLPLSGSVSEPRRDAAAAHRVWHRGAKENI